MGISRLAIALALSACATTKAPTNQDHPPLLPVSGEEPVTASQLASRHDATVFVWWSSSCPCVARYEARVRGLRARYDEGRVGIYAIVSNADETTAGARAEAARRGFDLPMYFDPGAALASQLRVRSTPSVVLFDSKASVRFAGWIDNEREPGTPGRTAYLEDALEKLLAGRSDIQQRSPTWGCPITRSLFEDMPECCRQPAATEQGNFQ